MRILLLGQDGQTNIGGSYLRAAKSLGHDVKLVDVRQAFAAPRLVRAFYWHVLGHRPVHLKRFGQQVVDTCKTWRPDLVLAISLAPMRAEELKQLAALVIRRFIFLTDDPWSSSHNSRWLLEALPHYDVVLNPRRLCRDDLKNLGCRRVEELFFAFDESIAYPPTPPPPLANDVVFVGTGDADRVPFISAINQMGVNFALYGSMWDDRPETRGLAKPYASPDAMRNILASSRLALCLGRRANRDGLAMRTFEIPAIGTAMVTEDTDEHRAIFGPELETVAYFRTPAELQQKIRLLLADEPLRLKLAQAARALMITGRHSYKDRLESILTL